MSFSADKIAQKIADQYCKETLRNLWKGQLTNASIEKVLEKPWSELKKEVSSTLILAHQKVYQASYVVLTEEFKS